MDNNVVNKETPKDIAVPVANCDHFLINEKAQQERILSLESAIARKDAEIYYLQDTITTQKNIWHTGFF